MGKTDFDNKLVSFDKRFTSNKTKYLGVQKKKKKRKIKLNSLAIKDYNFFR